MARVRIGSAEIELTLNRGKYTSAIADVKKQTNSLRDSMVSAATKTRSLTTALAGMTAAGFAAKEIFELGAAVEETQSKFDTVFGAESGSVQTAIDQFSTLAGLSKQAAQEITATSGAIIQGFGISGDTAARMSIQVSQLAADLASFNNIPIAETARAIQAGLTGEMESLKRVGIAVLDVDVKQRALLMTGKSLTSELTNQDIVMARLALVTERAGVQVGDLARTQDTAAAQARMLSAEVQNIKEQLAVALTPALTVVVTKIREFIGGMQLLGVEGAVAIAKFRVAWENSIFGSDEGLKKALDNLHHTSLAAREMRNEIVGINTALSGTDSGDGSGGTQRSIQVAGERALELTGNFQFLKDVAITVADNLRLVGASAGYAADEQERLNRATQQFNAIAGAVGFVSRAIPGLNFLSTPLSLITGGVSAGSGLKNSFAGGGGSAGFQADPTITIRVQGVTDGTVQEIRGKIRDFDNLDVPVPI